MPDPIPNQEIPSSLNIVVGETPLYLKTPQKIGGQEVTSLIIQATDKRGAAGIDSSVLLVKEPSRKKGEEGAIIDKPVNHVDPMDQMAWDKVSGVQWTDETGVSHIIPKEELSLNQPVPDAEEMTGTEPKAEGADGLSMTANEKQTEPAQPVAGSLSEAPVQEPPTEKPAETVGSQFETQQPEVMPEATPPVEPLPKVTPAKAREVLSSLTEDPNTITIVGLRAYETRALDLADRAMQRLGTPRVTERAESAKNLWDKTKDVAMGLEHVLVDTVWKQSIGGLYFHERARQYYLGMIRAAETPFAEQSIRLAEARATDRYNKKLADANFLSRVGMRGIEALRDTLGMRTAIQNMALEEIGVMKTNGELQGAETFEREAKAVRVRFGQDFDRADQFVRTQLGEKLEILDATKEEHKPLVEGIQGLLKQYATGEITDRAEFDKRTKEFFNATLKNVRPDIFAEAELYSSSLFDAAETLRNKMSHEAGLANIDEALSGMQIRLGLGQMGEVTSLEPTAVERGVSRVREVTDWLNKNNVIVPMVFNEVTIGSGVAIALSAVKFLQTAPFRAVAGITGPLGSITGGALAGGIFAGWREYGQLQKDYLTHLRERETGTQFTESMKRRAWFERLSVKQRSANEMMTTMQNALYETLPEGNIGDTLKINLTDDELRTTFATIADLQSRKAVSETGPKRIGLIQYSSREAIESERSALDIVANKALTDLDTYLSSHADQASSVLGGNTFSEFMVKLTTNQTQVLKQGVGVIDSFDDPVKATLGIVSQHAPEIDLVKRRWPFAGRETTGEEKVMGMDAILMEFNKEARSEAIKYGVRAGVIGAGVGAVLHLGDLHAAPDASHVGGVASTASIGHAGKEIGNIASSSTTVPPEGLTTAAQKVIEIGPPHQVMVDGITGANNEPLSAMLPPGYNFQHLIVGGHMDKWELIGPDKQVILNNLSFSPDGTLANATEVQQQLAAHGLSMTTNALPAEQIAGAAASGSHEIGLIAGPKFTITGDELPKGGLWDYFLIRARDANDPNGLATTNLLKNLFRLYTHDHQSEVISSTGHPGYFDAPEHLRAATYGTLGKVNEVDLTKIPNDAQIKLPESVFGQDAISRIRDLNTQAIKDYQHVLASNANVHGPGQAINAMYNDTTNPNYKMEAVILRLGYQGQDSALPTKPEDLKLVYDALHATVQSAQAPPETTMHQVIISASTPPGAAISGALGHDASGVMDKLHAAAAETTRNIIDKGERDVIASAAKQNIFDTASASARTLAENAAHAFGAIPQSEMPWFPIFIPYHASLEMAPVEIVSTLPKSENMLLSPFGMEDAFLTKDAITARRSPRLSENPAIQLKQNEEISWYLSQLPEQDTQTLTELLSQTTGKPISPDVRAVVTMPTIGMTTSVYDRLQSYVGQTNADGSPLNPKKVEYVVYDVAVTNQVTPSEIASAKADVERFMKDHPEAQVLYLSRSYEPPVQAGRIKRDMTNVVLSRIGTLPVDSQDVSILSDNGGIAVQPTYLASTISIFDAEPAVDLVTGESKLDPQAYSEFPMLFAPHHAFELFDALVRHGESGHVPGIISGNNAVRASTLAGVGGYNSATPIAEDRELAWMIQAARGDSSDTIRTIPALTTTADPTELSYRMLQHVGLADNNVARTDNDTYKTLGWKDLAQKANEAYTKELFEADLNNLYTGIYPSLKASNPVRFDAYFKRTMDTLGIQYEVTDGKIHLLDTTTLPANMAAELDTESFAKQAATEVVTATPPEPATPRESLQNLAGPAEKPASPEQTQETMAASISSPEVRTKGTAVTPETTGTPQRAETLPEGVEDRVNYILNKTKESTAAVDVTTGELMDYLKSRLEMAGNTRITDGKIIIDGNTVTLADMKAKSFVGNVFFNGKMVTDPQKGLIVDMNTIHYELPLLMRLFEGRIKNQLGHFNDTLLLHMSQRIPTTWKADRLDIVGGKIEVKFSKNTK